MFECDTDIRLPTLIWTSEKLSVLGYDISGPKSSGSGRFRTLPERKSQ